MAYIGKTDKETRKYVMHLHRIGWQAPNIAHIAGLKQGVVEQILRDKGIEM